MREHVTFTREELYELVWSKPRSRIAKEFSISDVGLTKLCGRHDIPTPPRGHWARLAAGQSPRRPPLPALKGGRNPQIRLAKTDGPADELDDELASVIAELRRPEQQIAVADRLRSPCDVVVAARSALADAKVDDRGIVERPARCIDVRVSRAQLARALRIADALFKAFKSRGWPVEVGDDVTNVLVLGHPIGIVIEEGVETIEITPKPDLEGEYRFHYDRRETVRRPSGVLAVRIREHHHFWGGNHRRNWRSSKTRRLEERLNDVLIGLVKLVSAIRADVAERERREALERERQARADAALKEQRRLKEELAREKANVQELLHLADDWRRSQDLRQLVEEARRRGEVCRPGSDGRDIKDWIEWALRQADRLDPFVPSPPSILDDAERIEHMCDDLRWHR